LSGQVFEQDTIEYMIAHCGKGDIVHAGTYFGDFVPALSRACAEGAKVWTFEPNRENFQCATITTVINDLHNVVMTNAGLGNHQGCLPFAVSDEAGKALGGLSHFVEPDDDTNATVVQAEVVRIDDVVPADRQVSILQLDVEGFEEQALSGGMETIQRCKPVLILERPPAQKWLADNIPSLNYQRAGKVHRNTVFTVV
jgi:FkbM family methyltransferase